MSRDVDTAALRCFVSTVRAGSMGRAAKDLGRTQPGISQQIRRLEDILDCSLLRRTATGVVATPEGDALLPLAERILALNDEAQVHLRKYAGRSRGQLRVGLSEDIAASGLQMALADFAHVHPELQLDVTVADANGLREAYRAGKLDIVLSDSLLVGQVPRKRRTCSLAWVAAASHNLSAREPVPLVLFRHPCEWRVRTVQALDRFGRRWRAAFESGSLIAIQAAVRAGVGIATLLPGNVETGIVVLDPRSCRLPAPPRVELALYRRPTLRTDPISDFLESLLWRATG
jgi:DNA-binding transcriptional LysR family regulator